MPDPRDLTPFPQPLSGNDMPRCGGIASMMRLPVETDLSKLDACFVGVPFDLGPSNRTGTRAGPRTGPGTRAALTLALEASQHGTRQIQRIHLMSLFPTTELRDGQYVVVRTASGISTALELAAVLANNERFCQTATSVSAQRDTKETPTPGSDAGLDRPAGKA